MNSMVALNELRAARNRKQQEKVQCDQVKRQLEKIIRLKQEKAALSVRLEALSQGAAVDELDVHEPESVRERKNILEILKEKISAYRLFGPCGLTVVDVDTDCLVVTFTSMWKNITESFVLKIVAVEGHVKVSGTTIPYFIDVQSMLDKSKSPAWQELMDDIGKKLNAYIHRKGELDFVSKEYEVFIQNVSSNEAVTTIDLTLTKTDRPSGLDKTINLYLRYPRVDATLPENVNITSEKISISSHMTSVLTHKFLTCPLSNAVPAVVEALQSCSVADSSDSSDESGQEDEDSS